MNSAKDTVEFYGGGLLSNETLGQWVRFYCARRVPSLNDDKI